MSRRLRRKDDQDFCNDLSDSVENEGTRVVHSKGIQWRHPPHGSPRATRRIVRMDIVDGGARPIGSQKSRSISDSIPAGNDSRDTAS